MIRDSDSILEGRDEESISSNNLEPIAVNVKICGRVYPMRVQPSDEARIRNAGKHINEQIENYQKQFGIDDKQDLLAMVAFDCVVTSSTTSEGTNTIPEDLSKKISSISEFIEVNLNN